MSFSEGKTTEGNGFIFRPDYVECVEEFNDGTDRPEGRGVIITMKSGRFFRTPTYNLLGIKGEIGS